MNTDTFMIIVAILGTGLALAAGLVSGQRELTQTVSTLRERMGRLDGSTPQGS